MVGVKYLKYFPQAIYCLPSGLTIFESVFVGKDETTCVIGGPLDFQRSNGCKNSSNDLCNYFYNNTQNFPQRPLGNDILPFS